MQMRNLVLFFLISIVLMVGWGQLAFLLWPPAKKPEPASEVVKAKVDWPWKQRPAAEQQAIFTRLVAAASAGGLPLSAEALVLAQPLETKKPEEKQPEEKKLAAQPLSPEEKAETIVLGEARGGQQAFFLQVKLSTKGASVSAITLTRFQAADDYGLAMWQPHAPDQELPLELAPPYPVLQRRNKPEAGQDQLVYDPRFPSRHYSLYHYERPDDDRPVSTLGERVWKKLGERKSEMRHEVAFSYELPDQGVRIIKTFSLGAKDYHLGLSVKLERLGDHTDKFRYQLTGAHGLPIEGVWYTTTYRSALFGREDKNGTLWRTLEDSRQLGSWQVGGERHDRGERSIRYAGVAGQYFASVVAVDNEQANQNFIERVRASIVAEPPETQRVPQGPYPWAPINPRGGPNQEMPFLNDINVHLVSEPLNLAGGAIEHRYVLYNGPIKVRLLGDLAGDDAVAADLVHRYEATLQLSTLTDYPSAGFFGWVGQTTGLSWLIIKFTNLIHWLLAVLHGVLPYGLCIVMLTIIVRGIMFPISRKQAASSKDLQEKMGKLAPEMKKLQEKYKDDFQALNQARLELYRKHNINPFASLGGCLLLLAQMPVFLGLYYGLQESIFFRLDRFLWIPNLAAPDMLIRWGEWIPMLSRPEDLGSLLYLGPFLNLLPILTIGLFIVQQKVMMPPPTDEQQEMQQNMMKWMMIVIGFMFYKVAAGLCIYFIASTLWGLAERQFLPKKAAPAGGALGVDDRFSPSGDRRKLKPTPDEEKNGWRQRLRNWWDDTLKEAGKQRQLRREDKRSRG